MEFESQESMAATARITIIQVRRHCRHLIAAQRRLFADARAASRVARKLKEGTNPFNRARIEKLETAAEASRSAAHGLDAAILDCGNWFLKFAPYLDAALTLEERLDLLGVNVADRARITDAEETGIVAILAVYGLEDSAMHRGSIKGAPMAAALNLVIMKFLCNSHMGRELADSLFEPGGLFAGVPEYRQAADGEMKRMPPRLRVVTPRCH